MNKFQKMLLVLVGSSVLSVSAHAATTFGNGQMYAGLKVGQFYLDDDGLDDLDDATAYGVYGGYKFDPNFGIEVEYVGSSDADFEFDGIDGEYDVKTYGAYGTYRYFFPNAAGIYAKGKLGIAKTEVDISIDDGFGGSYDDSSDDTGVAGGIGLGYSINPDFAVELEYALTDSDADAELLTLGAHLNF